MRGKPTLLGLGDLASETDDEIVPKINASVARGLQGDSDQLLLDTLKPSEIRVSVVLSYGLQQGLHVDLVVATLHELRTAIVQLVCQLVTVACVHHLRVEAVVLVERALFTLDHRSNLALQPQLRARRAHMSPEHIFVFTAQMLDSAEDRLVVT